MITRIATNFNEVRLHVHEANRVVIWVVIWDVLYTQSRTPHIPTLTSVFLNARQGRMSCSMIVLKYEC